MFRKLRRRTALYQIAVIALVLLAVFAFSCVYNYERMINTVDKRLSALEKAGDYFSEPFNSELERVEARNTLIIRVYSDGKRKLSDPSFYDEETVVRLLAVATEGSEKTVINGSYIAYSVIENGGDAYYTVYVYDYTGEYDSFIVSLLTMLITCVAVMAVVAFFVMRFTTRNLAPIEETFEKQKELVANASHELKTPLTIINTNLSILTASEGLGEEQKKWLSGIGTQVNRMSAMINEMLLLARFEAVREKDFTKVDLSTIVESVVLETEVLAFERNIETDSSVAPGISITARRDDMEKLVYIFIDNALKYTEPNGKITVTLASEKHKAVLKVRNTGEGIPRERMPKLFDRFYRCDESHTGSGSFGLGLSIAKAITDANNGTIGVDSKEGSYTEFIAVFKEAN